MLKVADSCQASVSACNQCSREKEDYCAIADKNSRYRVCDVVQAQRRGVLMHYAGGI